MVRGDGVADDEAQVQTALKILRSTGIKERKIYRPFTTGFISVADEAQRAP